MPDEEVEEAASLELAELALEFSKEGVAQIRYEAIAPLLRELDLHRTVAATRGHPFPEDLAA